MQPKTKYIILSNYKQKVSCDYIIVKPSTSVLSADESRKVADKCNIVTSWTGGRLRSFIKQVPTITFAFFEWFWVENENRGIWTVFYFFTCWKNRILQQLKKQSHNNYSYGVLFGLPVHGFNFVKVNTCFEDFLCVCVNNKPLKLAETDLNNICP